MNTNGRLRVLYVEDNPDSFEMLRVMLDMSQIDLDSASTVSEALTLAASETFDLYLLDTGLPDGNGLGLCRTLRAFDPEIPVLIYSGGGYPEEIRMGIAAGADAYIVKPHSDKLGRAITRLVADRRESLLHRKTLPPGASRGSIDHRWANSFYGSSVMTA